jgi:hypothetical protein
VCAPPAIHKGARIGGGAGLGRMGVAACRPQGQWVHNSWPPSRSSILWALLTLEWGQQDGMYEGGMQHCMCTSALYVTQAPCQRQACLTKDCAPPSINYPPPSTAVPALPSAWTEVISHIAPEPPSLPPTCVSGSPHAANSGRNSSAAQRSSLTSWPRYLCLRTCLVRVRARITYPTCARKVNLCILRLCDPTSPPPQKNPLWTLTVAPQPPDQRKP